MIYPRFIKKGDIIGVPAPSNGANDELKVKRFKNACKNLENLGYNIKLSKNINNSVNARSANELMRANEINEMFKDKDIEKFSLRAANASIIITNDKRKTLSSEKNKKRRYTSKWVDVDPDNQENLKFYIVQSIPVRLYGENLYQSKEVNGEKNDAVEKINKCVIEVKLTYKDGWEEQQYLVFSTASRGDVSPFSIYRADSK